MECEWKYRNLYRQLSEMTKDSTLSFAVRYNKMKFFLLQEGAVDFIHLKAMEEATWIWNTMDVLMEKRAYKRLFVLFVVKGWGARMVEKCNWGIKAKLRQWIPSRF